MRVAKYEWIEDVDLAWTLAVIQGHTVDEVVRTYRGEPVGTATFEGSAVPEESIGDYFHVQVFRQGQHVLAIENNGWCGSSPTIARRASADGGRFSACTGHPRILRFTKRSMES